MAAALQKVFGSLWLEPQIQEKDRPFGSHLAQGMGDTGHTVWVRFNLRSHGVAVPEVSCQERK